MKTLFFSLFLVFLTLPAWAVGHPDEQLRDPVLEARALNLTHSLRCVVCQNESIEESNADMARNLRIVVRKQIIDGKSDEQILDYLRARYGDFILLNPPMAPRTYALWYAPLAVLAAGLAIIFATFKRRIKK